MSGHASTSRVRCPTCGQYPTTTTQGTLRHHNYPWPHPQNGTPCPGSGTQTQPHPNQLNLPIQDDEYPEEDDYGRRFHWETNHSTGKHVRVYQPEDR